MFKRTWQSLKSPWVEADDAAATTWQCPRCGARVDVPVAVPLMLRNLTGHPGHRWLERELAARCPCSSRST
jgi:hypothetical protein